MSKHYQEREDGRVRKAYKSKGDDVTFSRFVKQKRPAGHAEIRRPPSQMWLPGTRHEAVISGRSVFHRRGVKLVSTLKNVLVSGHCNVKIGRDVRKGRLFRGYWIYTLSLEERATCPRTCSHWTTCYGNNMPYAKRVDHRDPIALERALQRDIGALLAQVGKHRTQRLGVLIRLHALGDFFDEQYVEFWANMLTQYDNLACFGYTAWPPDSQIGQEIMTVKRQFGSRFAIRWSNGGQHDDCTVPIYQESECPPGAFVCPEQTGRSEACGKCGLCWNTTRNVAFLEH